MASTLGESPGETVGYRIRRESVVGAVFLDGGFEAALIPAGEVKDPRRDTAIALLTSLAIIAAVYMLVQLVVVGVVPHAAGAKAPIAAAFGRIVGPVGVLLASLAAVLSISGWTMGNILASPRVLSSMADRGVLPRALARVHEHYRTPHVAIVVYALLALAFGALASHRLRSALSLLGIAIGISSYVRSSTVLFVPALYAAWFRVRVPVIKPAAAGAAPILAGTP